MSQRRQVQTRKVGSIVGPWQGLQKSSRKEPESRKQVALTDSSKSDLGDAILVYMLLFQYLSGQACPK